MTAAISTYNFDTSSVGIGYLLNRAWNFIIKTWPPAMRIKFI